MEERILEDEIARGIRYKKNPDGTLEIVDVNEELAEGEEFVFEVSSICDVNGAEVDDEDLVDLSPQEAERVRKEKAQANARRHERYVQLCEQGKMQLETGSYHAAELEYEKALNYDDVATEASVGYWRAKTADFTQPDVLIGEYVEAGIESLEFDLGYEAAEIIKRDYHEVFERRVQELATEEEPLQTVVEEKQGARRAILKVRRRKSGVAFLCAALPLLAALIVTVIFGLKNFTTPDSRYIMPTIVMGGVALVTFIVFAIVTNKFINVCRLYRKNEKLDETEEGRRLLEIREYKALYEAMLFTNAEVETETEEE